MFYWLTKGEHKRLKSVAITLETLLEQQVTCQERQRALRSDFEAVDADMSALWDKVNHSLARMAGRTKKSKTEEDAPQESGPVGVEQINLAIMRGEMTA